eukprot:s1597_g8.t1
MLLCSAAAVAVPAALPDRETQQAVFRLWDLAVSGSISGAELEFALTQAGTKLELEEVDQIFSMMHPAQEGRNLSEAPATSSEIIEPPHSEISGEISFDEFANFLFPAERRGPTSRSLSSELLLIQCQLSAAKVAELIDYDGNMEAHCKVTAEASRPLANLFEIKPHSFLEPRARTGGARSREITADPTKFRTVAMDENGTLERLQEIVRAVKAKGPLVQCLTNFVSMDFMANGLLALGAHPAMVHSVEELDVAISKVKAAGGAVSINIGTLDALWIESFKCAVKACNEHQVPWVLDPVAAGFTPLRTSVATELLEMGGCAVLRGNASEILSLSGADGAGKGVDSTRGSDGAVKAAKVLAAKYRCVVGISGAMDYVITPEGNQFSCEHGVAMLQKITAAGCLVSSIIAAFVAAKPAGFSNAEAALYAFTYFGICSEAASQSSNGPGSLRANLLDQLHGTLVYPNFDLYLAEFALDSFQFSLHFEPRSEHGGLCQTGVLVASAQDGEGRPLPLTCRWRRRIGSHTVEIPGITSSMYHASADDVGMQIICLAEPEGQRQLGVAQAIIGPFELDPITRMSLENIVSSGASRFPVRHFRDQNDPHPRDLQIHVTQEHVKVVHPGAGRGSGEVMAPYSADYPKVIIHPTDTCKFRLELCDEQDKIFHFVALSRTMRDLITLLVRTFHARQYVATSFILSRLFQDPARPGAPLTTIMTQEFDLQRLADRLGKELDRTVGQLESVERVVRNSNNEKRELQAQLSETIGSYTEAIEKLHQQLTPTKGGAAAALQLQIHDGRALNSRLNLEAQELRQQLEELQAAGDEGPALEKRARAIEAFKMEIAKLRAQINSLAGNVEMHSQRDMTRADELRRLRSDVNSLNREKEALEQSVAQADKEKDDLIENFLYTKGCLDKLQIACINSPACSPEHEREVAQLRDTYNQVVDERNRLMVKVEAMDKDREKQKQFRESALEKVSQANARLLEERDRLEKEKARVSALYQQTIGMLAHSAAKAEAEEEDKVATFEALKAKVVKMRDVLQKKEDENESLRLRLKRLARPEAKGSRFILKFGDTWGPTSIRPAVFWPFWLQNLHNCHFFGRGPGRTRQKIRHGTA